MKQRVFVGDFETTVYDGQICTEVWSSAIVELFHKDVTIHNSIEQTFEYLKALKENVLIYYHNLKFDGSFWLDYLMRVLELKQAKEEFKDEFTWQKNCYMKNNTFKYTISDKGQWYQITIKVNNKYITIQDSLKLLPFSLNRIGKSFKTTHKKLEMDYKGFRYAGCPISDTEREYIKNDVLVLKEALEIMYNEGHSKMTIGSCCFSEFKSKFDKKEYEILFPDLYNFFLDKNIYGSYTSGEYIRKSYRGGWCYVVKGKEKKRYYNGLTADVNSLYPSVMSSESGCKYPVGKPTFWKGNYIPSEINEEHYFFIRFKTQFYIKKDKLPFVQIKNNFLYKGTENLETSDIYYNGRYHEEYEDLKGNIVTSSVELTMTMIDYKLFLEHYSVKNLKILDGCYFGSEIGLFDSYMRKYKELKANSKGAQRELAKLFLNNLYGKMATNKESGFKSAHLEENILKFEGHSELRNNAGYIAIGSSITSYARDFTIRVAQQNYHGVNKRGFIYADTDSIHCDLQPNELKGVKVHDSGFCCWKLESQWDVGFFTRQKTYIEHITHEDLKPIDNPYYNVKCAGLTPKCKELFVKALTKDYNNLESYSDIERNFIKNPIELEDFREGLYIPTGKLLPKRIQGGLILVDSHYRMSK